MQFLRYIMFYKPTEEAKKLLSNLSESMSLKFQKTYTSFSITGNPTAISEGIKCIEQQLLDNFQVDTFRFRCHPDFLPLIKKSVKEPVEKELNVVIYCFDVNGSEKLEPTRSVVIYVKAYSTDSMDFEKACDILDELEPQSVFYVLEEDEFEYISNAEENVINFLKIGESYRVLIELQCERIGVTLHAFTRKEAKDCFHTLREQILVALNVVNCIELTKLQLKYVLSNKSNLVKSLSIKIENLTGLPPKLKVEGKRSEVEKKTVIIQELLNKIITKSHKLTHDEYTTMWKKYWHDVKDKIFQDEELCVELTTSVSDDSITCELTVTGEDVQKVENAMSLVTKIDGKIRECNVFADAKDVAIVQEGLMGNKLKVRKELVYHVEIAETNIIIVTPYHMPAEEVKKSIQEYILLEKEKLIMVKKSYELKYLFFTKKLKSQLNTIQSIADDCEINLVTDPCCAIEVKGNKVAVRQAEPQILQYILSLESDVTCSVLPVDYYSCPALRSPELLHLCKELEDELAISLKVQIYPEVLSSAIVKLFNPCVTVQICEGSISLDTSDAFINFTDANLTISKELKTIIGDAAAADCECLVKSYNGSLPAGKVVRSNIPGSNQKVIHAVIPNWVDGNSGEIDLITSAVIKSLELAMKYNAASVSLPFLSCIDQNLPEKVLAKSCLLAVHSFCEWSNFLHTIRFILPTSIAKVFNNKFTTGLFQQWLVVKNSDACSSSGDSVWLWKDDFGKYQYYEYEDVKFLNKESKANAMCCLNIGQFMYKIDFSAMTQTNTTTGKVRSIKCHKIYYNWMFNNSKNNWEYFSLQDSLKIENMYINRTDCHMIIARESFSFDFSTMSMLKVLTNVKSTIKRVSTNKSVLLSDKSDSKISIFGLHVDVTTAEEKLKSCINSLCLIKSINIPQKLVSILDTHIRKIEKDHRVKFETTASATISLKYNVKGFKEHVQEAVTAIYQTLAENSTLLSLQCYSRPKEWEPQSNSIELMEVSKGSSEWIKILNRLQETLPKVKLNSIQRIQNEHLWEKYCQHKERMSRKGSERVNEKELFHGTSSTPPEEIYKSEEGFDMRFSHAGMWGRGIYFAESAKYSASGYSYQKKTTSTYLYLFSRTVSEKQMFLAKVLTGDSYRSPPDQTLLIPPLKTISSSSEKIRYDTVNGNSHGGELIYIAYSNEKAYPMYLISFTD